MKNWRRTTRRSTAARRPTWPTRRRSRPARHPVAGSQFRHEYWIASSPVPGGIPRRPHPEPDVLCNREIKFAPSGLRPLPRRRCDSPRPLCAPPGTPRRVHLMQAADADKDQTYFLHSLDQSQLRTPVPLADLTKPQVRGLARARGLPNHAAATAPVSASLASAVSATSAALLPARPGEVRTPEGALLGRHDGLMYYTLGQRHGIGVGGVRGRATRPGS